MKLIIDISPLSATPRTGIGVILENLIANLEKLNKIEIRYFALLARGACKILEKEYPGLKSLAVPSRYLSQAIKYAQTFSLPLEWFVGSADAAISIEWLCLPLKSGNTIAIIADITPISNPEWHTPENILWFTQRLKSIEKHADMVIAISQATKKDIMELTKISVDKIAVIYPGAPKAFIGNISAKDRSEMQMKYKLPASYILFVGTQEPRKNLKRILEAYNQLLIKIKKRTQFLIVGSQGWGEKITYPQFVKRLDHINHQDLPVIYNLSDGLLFPSLKEGFGMPILEAFATQTPVLTSNLSSMVEIAGDAAILVDPYSVDDIARGIEKLLNMSQKEKKELIKKGKDRLKYFSFAKMARTIISEIQKIQ